MIQKIIATSPRPERATHDWAQFERACGETGIPLAGKAQGAALARLFGRSLFLTQRLIHDPQLAGRWLHSPFQVRPKSRERFLEELEAALQPVEQDLSLVARVLRHYRYEETLRLTIKELSGTISFAELGEERSQLAAACVEAAFQVLSHKLCAEYGRPLDKPNGKLSQFCVLGMGKLGGADLNYSSDIDLIYLYSSDQGGFQESQSETELSHHQFFVRLGELLAKLLSEKTADGFGYRVDLDLRPEGQQGTLANSIDAMEDYYETFGDHWEQMALVKALPIAGERALGEDFCRRVRPFVYPGLHDLATLQHLKELKEKIEGSLQTKLRGTAKPDQPSYNVKLGAGGIREIEFLVGALQRLYGGKQRKLRVRNTLQALTALKVAQLIPAADCENLGMAYRFLRTLENRLQMLEDRQTHNLPKDPQELAALAADFGGVDHLQTDLLCHTGQVRRLWNQFLEMS